MHVSLFAINRYLLFCSLLLCVFTTNDFIVHDRTPYGRSVNVTNRLLNTTRSELILLFIGDPQFNFECVPSNIHCKQKSAEIRNKHGLSLDCGMSKEVAKSRNIGEHERKKIIKQCLAEESLYANRLSTDVMLKLIKAMRSKPSALVINGDLTSYGHIQELELFQREWIHKIPLRILPGLGNHDYENNVNDCVSNHCANRMLFWLVKYAEKYGITLDYQKDTLYFLKTSYSGSFAYSVRVCSENGDQCAKIIQLQYRPNYATKIDAPFTEWIVTNSFRWLQNELENLRNSTNMPIFINLHHLDAFSYIKIKQLLQITFANRVNLPPMRVFVLYAHNHHMHELRNECIHPYMVSFIYVGSVPNNRFTSVKILPPDNNNVNLSNTTVQVFLLSANGDQSVTILKYIPIVHKQEYCR